MTKETTISRIKSFLGKLDYSFLIFLLISTLLWMSMQFSKTNIRTYSININYTIPDTKLLDHVPDQKLIVKLKSKTWNLLNTNKFSEKINVNLEDRYHQVISEATLYNMVNAYVDKKYEIVNIIPSSLSIDLVDPAMKKVPVKLKGSIQPKPGYSIISNVQIIPDSISVYGTQQDIKDIETWYTSATLDNNLVKDVDQSMDLESISNHNSVSIVPRQVRIQVEIDQLAEKSFKRKIIPLDSTHLYSIPSYALIKLSVPLRSIDKIDENDIHIRIDHYQDNDTISRYKLEVNNLPLHCKLLQIAPDSVTVFKDNTVDSQED